MRGPGIVFEKPGQHPAGILCAQIDIFLREKLETRRHGVPPDALLTAALPCLVRDDTDIPPTRRHQQARTPLMNILKVASPRIVSSHGDDVPPLREPPGHVHFVVGPAILKSPGGAATDVLTVDVQLIRLISRDIKRRAPRDGLQGKVFPEQSVTIPQIPAEVIGPDPHGFLENIRDRGGNRRHGAHWRRSGEKALPNSASFISHLLTLCRHGLGKRLCTPASKTS